MLTNRYAVLPILSVLLASLLTATWAEQKASVKFVRLSLADSSIGLNKIGKSFVKYDPEQGYYLFHAVDCNSQSKSLHLIPDAKHAGQLGLTLDEVQHTSLPRLRTGSGVNIGDNPQQVQRKNGLPTKSLSYSGTPKVRAYLYTTPVAFYVQENGRKVKRTYIYRAVYVFHGDKLWAIKYDTNLGYLPDGCE